MNEQDREFVEIMGRAVEAYKNYNTYIGISRPFEDINRLLEIIGKQDKEINELNQEIKDLNQNIKAFYGLQQDRTNSSYKGPY